MSTTKKKKYQLWESGVLYKTYNTEKEANHYANLLGLAVWDQFCQGSGMPDPSNIEIREIEQ